MSTLDDRVERRRARVPKLSYPADLPVSARRDELVAAVRDHQVVIVAGETGSGKSTQLPKICLEAGRGVQGLIGHTQPRRLAARTIAERVAEEVGSEVGDVVGYTVRFTDRVGEGTLVRVMTDGILLAEIQRDRDLSRYDTLIVDEAHERSLNIDFILGYLKGLVGRRPDLKVIVTSATIDTERFSAHFGGAPVVEVTGRSYPVEVRYRPIGEDPDDERDQTQAVIDAVAELGREGSGDVLVFLSGEREIRDTADALAKAKLRDTEVLPLYARLSAADQHRVFQHHRTGRRVVLATNVAETSLTVPGIRYVVDPGTARISRYNRRTKVQRLPIEAVSQASADQRAGRCGRVAPGTCIRLYAEDDFAARPEFTEPEVLRTNLASVILQMTAIGLGDVAAFPFVEAPDQRSIDDGVALLDELGALAPARKRDGRRLTALGRRLAQLPVDPRLGRMVLEADTNGCVAEVLVIAAALSIQDPRERPTGYEREADEAHARFEDPTSDFLAYLNLWEHVRREQRARSSNQFRRMCRAEHLHHLRIREWQDVHTQLRRVLRSLGIRPNRQPAEPDQIHRSLLAGLLSHVGMRRDDDRDPRGSRRGTRGADRRSSRRPELLGARNTTFAIAPDSALSKKPPAWAMVAELVETNRLWGRVAARIEPEWAEQLGAHLVKRSYGEPWWDAEEATAMVHERVTLYGVPLVAARPVRLGRVDPAEARDRFIDHALVEGSWPTHHAFLAANEARAEEVRALEDRVRRRDILVTDEDRFDLYDRRVPGEVTSGRDFDRWWDAERRRRPDLLTFTTEDLIDPDAGDLGASAFPDLWHQGDLAFGLTYVFDPSSDLDGVTVEIPLALIDRVSADGFDWQVPGRRAELVTALIRSVPKVLRRRLGPAGELTEAFLAHASPADGPLLDVLAAELGRGIGEPVPPASFDLDRVPDHLRMTFRVVDERDRPVAWSKDLPALRAHLQPRLRSAIAEATRSHARTGLTDWTIGALGRSVEVYVGDHAVTAHPALVDEGDTVAVRAFASRVDQHRAMWPGTRRLLLLATGVRVGAVARRLGNETKLALSTASDATAVEVLEDCVTAALDQVLSEAGGPAWDEAGFRTLARLVEDEVTGHAVDLAVLAGRILAHAHHIEQRLDTFSAGALQDALTDIGVQVARLVHRGFVAATGADQLAHVPRYLRAVDHRLDKLPKDHRRDRARMQRVHDVEDAYDSLRARRSGAEVAAVRWMVEELRVSLFAQALGTPKPISEQRVLAEIARLR